MCHKLASTEGLVVGGSAGLNVYAAFKLAEKVNTDSIITTLLCDGGIKYLSKIFND